ncbi:MULTISPECIES: hypothetical protein [Spirulina sp. CCY15215]|uniref:hypothetical protein n=1 Tax=Spirulina sp. CCY15215 TaxID=2767591 RepID=UPI00194F5EE9|nr:hypothetical protein [Spirulina major]
MLKRANIVLSQGRHRGIDDYMDYLLELLNSIYESVMIGDTYRADSHNYIIDGNFSNERDEIEILSSAGVVIIFIASEWVHFFKGVLYFNTFQHRDFLISRFLRKLSKKRRSILTNRPLKKILSKFFDVKIDELYYLANRSEEFEKNASFFTAIIGPSKDLVTPYSDFYKVPAFAIEPLFEEGKFLDREIESSPKLFFSGKLTKFRQAVLSNLNKIHPNLTIEYVENSTNLPPEKFTHELYIPQKFRWPYSSPIRTYRSYTQGFIPVNFSQYSQSIMDSYLPILSESSESYKQFISYKTENLVEGAKASNAVRKEQIKVYVEYLSQGLEQAKIKPTVSQNIQLVLEGYKGFNIVKVDKEYYAIPQCEGKFSLDRIERKDHSVFFMAENEADVCRQIIAFNEHFQLNTYKIQLIKKQYQGFNIVKVDKKYYAIPQEEGKFSLDRIEQKDYSILFVANSQADIHRQITEYKNSQIDPGKSKIQSTIENYISQLIAVLFDR